MRVYKGILLPKYYSNSKIYHGKTKNYFYTPIKKLFGNWWLTVYYKKNTQYYRKKALLYLIQYVDLAINEVTKLDDKTYLKEKDLSKLNNRNTLWISCYSKQDDTYIGNPYKVMKLIKNKRITEFYGDGRNDIAIIGYSPKNNKLYHWINHNLIEIRTEEELTTENIRIIAKQIGYNLAEKDKNKS
jgi:hypothetical protein